MLEKARRQDKDVYDHVMQLDDGNSEASLACIHMQLYNKPYIVTTSSHSDLRISGTPLRRENWSHTFCPL